MTATDRIQGVFRVTPVSAVHIGSGNELIDLDYEIRDGEFRVKDLLKYIEDQHDNPEAAVKAIEDGLPLDEKYIRYRMPCYGDVPRAASAPQRGGQGPGGGGRPGGGPGRRQDQPLFGNPKNVDPQMRKLMKQSAQAVGTKQTAAPAQQTDFPAIRQSGPKVREFIKDPFGSPYLPGSTLKGCLRTAIAYFLANENDRRIAGEIGKNAIDLTKSQDQRQRPPRERLFGRAGNDLLFGKGVIADPLKALIVRDSAPLDITRGFAMTHVQVMNVIRQEFKPKHDMHIYTESLMPDAGTIEIPFYLDLWRLRKDEALSAAAGGKTVAILRDHQKFADALRAFSNDFVNSEMTFYQKHGANNGLSFLREAQKKGTILLDLGFGTGWTAKTIGLAMDDDDIYDIRKHYGRYGSDRPNKNMGSPGAYIFPKTRKWAATSQRGEYHPMGWIALDIEWQ